MTPRINLDLWTCFARTVFCLKKKEIIIKNQEISHKKSSFQFSGNSGLGNTGATFLRSSHWLVLSANFS